MHYKIIIFNFSTERTTKTSQWSNSNIKSDVINKKNHKNFSWNIFQTFFDILDSEMFTQNSWFSAQLNNDIFFFGIGEYFFPYQILENHENANEVIRKHF